jgi:signal transduction histidine kinase
MSDLHSLDIDVADGLPEAHGDPMATDIIIGQLLENAFKYSPEGGAITVSARADGDAIVVEVADQGIGITPEDRERVFERFVQGEAGDRRRFGGIGLGLYIVRQLVRAQGGEIAADSPPGGGTVIRLKLRRADAADEAARTGAPALPRPRPASEPSAT